jgi:hypothetical protein
MGIVLFDVRFECAFQVSGGIPFNTTRGNAIHKNLTTILHGAVGKFQRTTFFNDAYYGQQFRGGNVFDGATTQLGEKVILKPFIQKICIAWCPGGTFRGNPFTSNGLKANYSRLKREFDWEPLEAVCVTLYPVEQG